MRISNFLKFFLVKLPPSSSFLGDSDKENAHAGAAGARKAVARGQENVINASTWLSNILPTPRGEEEENGLISRENSPQHKAISSVQVIWQLKIIYVHFCKRKKLGAH